MNDDNRNDMDKLAAETKASQDAINEIVDASQQTGYPQRREGRLTRFEQMSPAMTVLGRPSYRVISQRGGFYLGTLEFRNQWQMYGFTVAAGEPTPLNKVMIAEIYAMLKELDER